MNGIFGADGRNRTDNLFITSELLCHWATSAHQRFVLYQDYIVSSSIFYIILKMGAKLDRIDKTAIKALHFCTMQVKRENPLIKKQTEKSVTKGAMAYV